MPDPLRHPLVRRLLERDARRRLGRRIRVRLVERGSWTDLDETIAVAIGIPPGAPPADRLVVARASYEHELLHLRLTDATSWREAVAEAAGLDRGAAALALLGALEDGRIEWWARVHEPATAARITAAERLAPRVTSPAASIALAVLAAALPDGAGAGLPPALEPHVAAALDGTTADAWRAAKAILALRPELAATAFAELRPPAGAGGDGAPGTTPAERVLAPPRAGGDPMQEAHALLARVAEAQESEVRGGRAGLDTWEPAAGERIVPAGVLREQVAAHAAPRVALAADACAQELLRVIRARQDTRRRIRSGHLDPGALAGVLAGRRTVYRQPSRAPRRTVALLVVADLSDSTADQRPELREALHLARLACDGAGVAIAVHGFSGTDVVEHQELLTWDGDEVALDAVLEPSVGGGTTPAAAAIDLGRRVLGARPETDRVLLVLTDGEPNGGPAVLRSAVDEARHDGVVVFGCYFGDDRRTRDALAACFDDDFAVLRDLRDAAPRVFARIADLLT